MSIPPSDRPARVRFATSGWVFNRIAKLKADTGLYAKTGEVRDALGVPERTLRYWMADPYFKAAAIAVIAPGTKRWVWHLDRLVLWIAAMGKVRSTVRRYAFNPPDKMEFTRDSAREQLGIPLDHRLGEKDEPST